MKETKEFRVSAHESEYLKQPASIEKALGSFPRIKEGAPGHPATVMLSRSDAERLRESLTTQLATVGFDINYSPDEQGRMLEDLIDRFNVP